MRTFSFLLALAALGCRGGEDDTGTAPVDADGDGVAAADDCNDTDPAVFPGAVETCDGVDTDCDGTIDDDPTDASTFYADGDGDGYGNSALSQTACDAPGGYTEAGGDCDDGDGAVHPGAAETDCSDPIDYNCDGASGFTDADGDGFAACEECDDTSAAVNPSAVETCDGIDNDCDTETDEAGATGSASFYADGDGDGFGDASDAVDACDVPVGYVDNDDDCDDDAGSIYPGAAETCDDVDQNCNGVKDEDPTDPTTWYVDGDGDGHGSTRLSQDACKQPPGYAASSDDCDDLDPKTYTGASEQCDGKDNDCDGAVPADETAAKYADADGDGFGNPAVTKDACTAPSSYVDNADDCDDTKASAKPGGTEIPGDGIDNDCDGGDLAALVYVPARTSGELWAINRKTGDIVWKKSGLGGMIDVAAGPGGELYVSQIDAGVSVLPADGSPAKPLLTGKTGVHGVWYDTASDTLLVAASSGFIWEIDPADGTVTELAKGLGEVIDAIRLPGDGRIWFTHRGEKKVKVLSGTTVSDVVTLPNGPNLMVPTPAGTFYVAGGPSGDLYDVDVRRGRYTLVKNVGKSIYGICADGGRDLLFADHDKSLYALDIGDGFVNTKVLTSDLAQPWSCATNAVWDLDGDGFVARELGGDDCDDTKAAVNPDATDASANGADENCDWTDGTDADGDGSAAKATGGTDCDDADPAKFLGTVGCDAAVSCDEILLEASEATTGLYRLDPQETGTPTQVWCDMDIDGGGWTLVGRSAKTTLPMDCAGTDGGTNFGWKSKTGDVTNDVQRYSLDANGLGIAFTEVMWGDWTTAKNWGGNVYKHKVESDFLTKYATTHYRIGNPATVKGTCANPSMFTWIGFTNNLDTFHLRDVDGNGFGLSGGGFRSCYDNCGQGGELNTKPGMIMVR